MFGLFKKKETNSQREAWINQTIESAGNKAYSVMLSQLNQAKRGFEAAETPAWTSTWQTTSNEINIELSQHLPVLRSRARELGRNNEWAKRYLIQLKDNVVGASGIRLQMRMSKRNGEPDAHNDRIEQAWARFCRTGACEVSGKLTFNEIEKVLIESLAINGEFFVRLRRGEGAFGIMLQVINPALVDVSMNGSSGNNRIRMGIEINDDGKPIAYYIRAGKSGESAPSPYTVSGKHIRIPADEIIHGFDVCEVDQLRGVPWLTTGASFMDVKRL